MVSIDLDELDRRRTLREKAKVHINWLHNVDANGRKRWTDWRRGERGRRQWRWDNDKAKKLG